MRFFSLLVVLGGVSLCAADPSSVVLRNGMCEAVIQAAPFPRLTEFRRKGEKDQTLASLPGHPEWSGLRVEFLTPQGHTPHSALPGNQPATITAQTDRFVRLESPADPVTRLALTTEIELDPHIPLVRITAIFRNTGPVARDIAPWFIAVVPTGGRVLIPWESDTLRGLTLFGNAPPPDGLTWGTKALMVDLAGRAADAPPVKFGVPFPATRCARITPAEALLLWTPAIDGPRPDHNSGVTVFLGPGASYLEMETVAPLARIAPDGTVSATAFLRIVGGEKFPAGGQPDADAERVGEFAR